MQNLKIDNLMNIFYSSLDILRLIHSKISQIEYLENFGKGVNGYHTSLQ